MTGRRRSRERLLLARRRPPQRAHGDHAVGQLLLARRSRARAAPDRSAAFIWARIALPSNARSQRMPAARSSAVRWLPGRLATSTTNTSTRRRGREHVFGIAGDEQALDARTEADAGRGRAAELLDQAVVATAAEDRGLGVSTARARTRRWCACSSRTRGPAAGSSMNGMPQRAEPGLHAVEVAWLSSRQVVGDRGAHRR